MVGAGAYYLLSSWLAVPLIIGYERFTSGTIYRGYFNAYVVEPLVSHLPQAIVAAVVGVIVIWLVESDRPVAWALVPAWLYAVVGFRNHHWMQPPTPLDRVRETIGALFPALACIVAGIVAARRVTTQHETQKTPD